MATQLPVEIWFDPALASPEAAADILGKLADFSPILQEIGGILETGEADWFDSRGEGTWDALTPATRADKARKGFGDRADLVRTGELREALTTLGAPGHKFIVTGDSVTIGADDAVIPWANYQASMRVIVNITADTMDRVIRAITDWLGGGDAVRVYVG